MNPVTAYLNAIRSAAPSGAAGAAIVARASAAVAARITSREGDLGRELTDAETEAELKALGDPADIVRRFAEKPSRAPRSHEMIDRYIAAVERHLPGKTAKDIVAELREALFAKVEGREAELGRALDRDEVAAILKSFGSPMLAASRYSSRAYLIGPTVYPYFWPAQRIVIGALAALIIVVGLIRAIVTDDPWRVVGYAFAGAWQAAWIGFAVTTVVFIALERTGASLKYEETWNPRQLPRESGVKPKSLFESLFSLAWDAVFIAWWIGAVHVSGLVQTNVQDQVSLHFSEAWAGVHLPILALSIFSALTHLADVFRPAWSRLRGAAAVLSCAGALAVCGVLARSGQLIVVEGPSPKFAEVQQMVDMVCRISLAGVALGCAIGLIVEAWRLVRSLRTPAAPAMA